MGSGEDVDAAKGALVLVPCLSLGDNKVEEDIETDLCTIPITFFIIPFVKLAALPI